MASKKTTRGKRTTGKRTASAWSPRPSYGVAPQRVAKPNLPPRKGAPLEQPPIGVTPRYGQLAPYPLIDRYPVVIGQNLNLSYVASVFRLATTGYRQQYVDLLDELLEQDPHLFSVVQKRVLAVANGKIEVVAHDLPDDHPKLERAEELAKWVQTQLDGIPEFNQQLAGLLWGGGYYGVGAAEIHWRRDGDGWSVERLTFIHSRRLAYPDPQAWDLYVWDQGQVYGWQAPWGASPTNQSIFGMRVADYPGKFLVYAPQLRGDYPTRDGLGRQTSTWAVLKRVAGRYAGMYLERFAKPYFDGSWTTQGGKEGGKPREAEDEDILGLKSAVDSLGTGGLSSYVHPDTITVDIKSADAGRPKVTFVDWLHACNAEMSKAVLGGTLGTDVMKGGGNRALGEVQERAELDLETYDGVCMGDSLDRDVVQWLVRLNYPEDLDIVPHVVIYVAKDPDPKTVLQNVWMATQSGMAVDQDWVAEEAGLRLVPGETESNGRPKPRRTYKSDFVDPTMVDDSLMSDEAKQQEEDDRQQKLEVMKQKAKQPPVLHTPQMQLPLDGGAKPEKPDAEAIKPAVKATPKAAPKEKTEAVNARLRGALLMSDRMDRDIAVEVFDQLADDYPKHALHWVLAGHWTGPEFVPTTDIDFSNRARWRASHEPIDSYVDKIKRGKQKPVVLVKTPSNPKFIIVDGHHRTLASENMKRPVRAYIATVRTNKGPWDELHAMQKGGGSGTQSASWLPSHVTTTDKAADVAV